MARLNMKLEIVNILDSISELADFSMDYPEEMTSFPYAIYRTIATPHVINANREEMLTKWDITIELYGTRSVSSLADEASSGLRGIGLRVTQRDSNVAGLKRIVLNCQGIVDNAMKQVYL